MTITVRDAVTSDVEGICLIYNDVVAHSTAIWNDVQVDVPNRLAWLNARRGKGFPVLVAADEGNRVLGYATFGDWRAFDGYRHTVEHSVHISHDSRGLGLGTRLMTALIEQARAMEKHVMVAAIEAENRASIRLHEKLGFEHTGTLNQVGTKFGKWLDLAFMQLLLDHRSDPDPISPST